MTCDPTIFYKMNFKKCMYVYIFLIKKNQISKSMCVSIYTLTQNIFEIDHLGSHYPAIAYISLM